MWKSDDILIGNCNIKTKNKKFNFKKKFENLVVLKISKIGHTVTILMILIINLKQILGINFFFEVKFLFRIFPDYKWYY